MEQRSQFKANLTDGPIGKALYQMTLPMIAGMLAMMIFNIVDTYFVARLGSIPLAAMGFTFPVVFTVGHVALGIGIGASSVIARKIGEGDGEQVQRITTDSILLSFIVVLVTAILGFFTIEPLFRLMGASQETTGYIIGYMRIWYAGVIFVVVPMVGNHAMRAGGDTLLPGIIMGIGSVLNMILDPLLIFGYAGLPAMGIRGAALATVISRATTLALALWFLYAKKKMITFRPVPVSKIIRSWLAILHVALPSALSMMVPTVCLGILTWMVSGFGQKAVAGFGVAGRVEGLALVLFIALSTVFGPFIGQNYGALKISRIRKGLTKVMNFSLGWGTFQAIILFMLAEPIAGLFDKDPQVMRVAVLYLKIVPLTYAFVSIVFLISSAFNALGHPVPAIWLMLIRLVALHLPLAWIARDRFGLAGFLSVHYLSGIVSAVIAIQWLRSWLKKSQIAVAIAAAEPG